MEKNELIKKVCIKNRMCCYFDEIIKIEDNVDGFIGGYGGTKNTERRNSIFNRNRCLIRLKSCISHIVSQII